MFDTCRCGAGAGDQLPPRSGEGRLQRWLRRLQSLVSRRHPPLFSCVKPSNGISGGLGRQSWCWGSGLTQGLQDDSSRAERALPAQRGWETGLGVQRVCLLNELPVLTLALPRCLFSWLPRVPSWSCLGSRASLHPSCLPVAPSLPPQGSGAQELRCVLAPGHPSPFSSVMVPQQTHHPVACSARTGWQSSSSRWLSGLHEGTCRLLSAA